ncbi:MAG: sulfatase-like hydrolase/transferase [Bacteroidota bacterium]
MKRAFILTGLLLMPILFFLLRPLSSSEFEITWDKELIAAKYVYLDSLKAQKGTSDRPNIVILLADDLGISEVSAYGLDRIQTKNIDAIAKNGVLFTEAYVTSPICSPSRASLLTGRYQQRFGYELQPQTRYPKNLLEFLVFKYLMDTDGWVVSDEKISYPRQEDILKQGLPPSEVTLSEMLKAQGYNTGIIGKWHLGSGDFALPLNRGFDYQYGFYEAFSMYAYEEDTQVINHHHDWLFSDKYIWGPGREGKSALYQNGKEIVEREYLTDKLAKEAVNFVDRNKNEPFFLYVPFSAPHTPFQAKLDDYKNYEYVEDENKRVYYAMIKSLDDAVGTIMQKLESESLLENTLVFFLSDNGGASYTRATDNYPLKGGKFTNFEGGIRVPFMMHWKGKISEGMTYTAPISSLDIFATSMAAVDGSINLPKHDGADLIAFLNDNEGPPPHEALYWRSGYNFAIRKGQWKLILNRKDQTHRFYNIVEDPSEVRDVYAENRELALQLENQLMKWSATLIQPRWPRIMDWQYLDGEEIVHFAL